MKMVKSLLLGSAAGLVAVAGAQAADLPVKAKPVQYVKICSLYGAGFYYIPGTDMCLKIGGWVRAEYSWGQNGSSTKATISDLNNRATNNMWWRVRGYITADARNQTEYGTVRSYIAVGISTDETADEAQTFNANRAFIQFAGFTFGRAASFFDFYGGAATSYFGFFPQSDTGDGGKDVLAYTAQFGNGFSASISAEQRRTTQIIGSTNGSAIAYALSGTTGAITGTANTATVSAGSLTGNTTTAAGYGGWQVPDLVANLRVDQAWGSAQVSGALHQVNANYYSSTAVSGTNPEGSGHPGDTWGFAVAGGLKLNAPMIGRGDYFHAQVNYTQGALGYLFQNPKGNWYIQNGQSAAYGIMSDGVYGGTSTTTPSSVELTTAWGVNAAYEHFWTPNWRTSVHGGYYAVSYNSTANAILCSMQGPANGAGAGTAAVAVAGCNMNWNTWWVGSRTQWNITKDFYMGVDVAYASLQSANTANGALPAAVVPAGTATGGKTVADEGNWFVRFRVHRDFYP